MVQWKPSKIFPESGPQRCFPHAMCRHNGKLFVAYPGAYAFDGNEWTFAGDPYPLGSETSPSLQTHSLTIHQGKLCAGTWPEGNVSTYRRRRNVGRRLAAWAWTARKSIRLLCTTANFTEVRFRGPRSAGMTGVPNGPR